RGRVRAVARPPCSRQRRRHPPRCRRLAPQSLGVHPAMPFEVLHAVLPLPLVRLRLAEDLRATALRATEMSVDIADHHDDTVDEVRSLEPLARQCAGLRVTARSLI